MNTSQIDIKVNGKALPTIPNTTGWLDHSSERDFCLTKQGGLAFVLENFELVDLKLSTLHLPNNLPNHLPNHLPDSNDLPQFL